MKAHFLMMAEYNAWANTRLYRMAAELPDELYRKDVGIYFRSLHATLNHILVADLIWLRRLTGIGDQPTKLDGIVCDDLPALTSARRQQDQRINEFVATTPESKLAEVWQYPSVGKQAQRQLLREILAHLFNHQTHHRGQAHSALTRLGVAEPASLDLLAMYRERSA